MNSSKRRFFAWPIFVLLLASTATVALSQTVPDRPTPDSKLIYDASSDCWGSDGNPAVSGKVLYWFGTCKNHLFSGQGTLVTINGQHRTIAGVQLGFFADGYLEGEGRLAAPGFVLKGSFRNGMIEGHAVYEFQDGSKFDGQFERGMKSGHGVATYPSGKRVEGEFRDNGANGAFREINPDGSRLEGTTQKGELIGDATYTTALGESLKGKYIGPKPDPAYPHGVQYPAAAQTAGESGTAIVSLTISEDGTVSDAKVVRSTGISRLDDAAIASVLSWRYLPATIGGKALKTTYFQTNVVFNLIDAPN